MEKMNEFFARRIGEYEEHMIRNVNGCREGYFRLAAALPGGMRSLLDLGCGTGLELDAIFERFPRLAVTGIDLTAAMLDRLREKHGDKRIHLICGDYFQEDLGKGYNAAVSFQSLHHFAPQDKLTLYRRIFQALQPGGLYLECDYMAADQQEEAFYFGQRERLLREAGQGEGLYHYDTRCTPKHQMKLLASAGFCSLGLVWRQGNTVLLRAEKPGGANDLVNQ